MPWPDVTSGKVANGHAGSDQLRIRIVAVTDLRGTIAVPGSFEKVSWSSDEDKRWFREFTTRVGVVVMGRKTYETLERPLPGRLNVVLSRSDPLQTTWPPDIVLAGDVGEVVEKIRSLGYNDICVIGGRSVYSQFLRSGLVTDLHITVEPLILPDGLNLIEGLGRSVALRLEKVVRLNEGGTLNLHYTVIR